MNRTNHAIGSTDYVWKSCHGKSLINREQVFVSNQQSAIIFDPGERSFNDPTFSIASQLAIILQLGFLPVFSMWTTQINLALFQFFRSGSLS
jgi:hypothetical protein